jgi:hypothetical protein
VACNDRFDENLRGWGETSHYHPAREVAAHEVASSCQIAGLAASLAIVLQAQQGGGRTGGADDPYARCTRVEHPEGYGPCDRHHRAPTVDDTLEARDAARFSRYPPVGRRSSGGGSFGQVWPAVSYRATVNDNMLVTVMIVMALPPVRSARSIRCRHPRKLT